MQEKLHVKHLYSTNNMLLPFGAVGEKSFSDPTSDA